MNPKDPQLDEYQNLALLCRALWRQGFDDLLPGRVSLRQDRGTFLISAADRRWDQMRARDVALQSADGLPLEGSRDDSELKTDASATLHRQLHANRSDAVWVGLLRSRAVLRWACTERVPLAYDDLAAFCGRIEMVGVSTVESEVQFAQALGDLPVPMPVLLVSGFGALVTAETLEQFATRAVALEVRCRTAADLEGVADARELKPDRERQLFARSCTEGFGLWSALVARELHAGSDFLD